MKRLTLGLLAFTTCLFGAEVPAKPDVVTQATEVFAARVEAATKELGETRASIAAERLPLVKVSRELEERAASLEAEIARIEAQQGQFEENRKSLIHEGELLRKNLIYLATLAQESLKSLADGMAPGEATLYAERTEAIHKGLESSDTSANTTATLGTAELLLTRLEYALGGYGARGKSLIAENNELLEGSFVFFGPESFFLPDTGSTAGTARFREGSPFPVMYPMLEWGAPNAAAFFKAQAATVMLDASGGKALQLKHAQGTLWKQVERGGLVAYVILGVGALGLLLAIIKAVELSRLSVDNATKVEALLETLVQSGPAEAAKGLSKLKRTTRELFETGFRHFERSKEILEEHVFAHVLKQRLRFERRLPLLAVIATASPLLGLLGTVTGMVKTFTLITVFGTGSAARLSSGISEALITTELGLVVAIPALIAHGFLSHRLHKGLSLLERYSFEFITASEEAKEKVGVGGKFP